MIYVDSKASGVAAVDRSQEEIIWGAIDNRTYLNPAGVNVVFELLDPAAEEASDGAQAEFLTGDFRFIVTQYELAHP